MGTRNRGVMDENELRALLGRAVAYEPGLGPLVDNAVRAGTRIRRRRRVLGAVGCVAVIAVVGGMVPVLGHALAGRPEPTTAHTVRPSPSGLGPSLAPDRQPSPSASRTHGPVSRSAPPAVVPSTSASGSGAGASILAVDSYGSIFTVNSATHSAGKPVGINGTVVTSVVSPDGKTMYALVDTDEIVPISTTTHRIGRSIPVPSATAIVRMTVSPSGRFIYLSDYPDHQVLAVDVARRTVAATISTGLSPDQIAFSPSGTTGYVADTNAASVTVFSTVTQRVLRTIKVGQDPVAIATSPSGTVYTVNEFSGTVTPIDTSANVAGRAIRAGDRPQAIVFTPSGTMAYVTNYWSSTVTPIDLASGRALPALRTGSRPSALVITPSGSTVYVLDNDPASVTPIDTLTETAEPSVRVLGAGSEAGQIAVTPDGSTVLVSIGSQLVPISTATNRAGAPIRLSAPCCEQMMAP